ncbi:MULTISPECIES: IS91 family transposase [Shewanella]|uniref:IS91 family transposase n=5 Tax=Gammaproteobacteria TaxID=1236 RepID=A0A3N4DD86_9GAMM|nr:MULTISPECIES: IS91 family transposase [Shewanella]AZG33587.1 IS91 family transposase [Shewanella psychromarinicola]AZG33661.1 IS91 family transposase [Shewanella psychromarinicola]MBO1896898.1 IS91 family transposase [Shewanella sp. BF02_Schw]RPA22507.1 IS91 family transposase [Shewanella psychromarinicola]
MTFIDILRDHLDAFNQAYDGQITPSMRQAINAMLSCRSHSQRASHWACQGCTHTADFPLSCGHRSCPQCQYNTTADWLTKQQAKLLPVDYFMVTFTLPFELRVVAKYHPEALYPAMFAVAASVLKDFALNSPKLAGDIGFTGVLHTHSRRRDLHPHIHFIIPAGSFNKTQQHWKKNKGKYLFNAFNIANVWRARLLEYLAKLNLTLPTSLPKKWVVDCQHVGKGLPALQYLSRYLYRGVLADKNIKSHVDDNVSFEYEDSQTKSTKVRTLPAIEFLWLILQHVLPKGLRRVRDYGLLRGNAKKLRLQIQLMLAVAGATFPIIPEIKRRLATRSCPCCQQPMRFMGVVARPTNLMTST